MAVNYEKDKDYTALIQQAAASGDYTSAANYEQQRNAKIAGEGLDYTPTSSYAGYLDKTDYSDILREQMASGATADAVQNTLDRRKAKAQGTVGMEQYANDAVSQAAAQYVKDNTAPVYNSKYDDVINTMYNRIMNMNYPDWQNGSEYKALADKYAANGRTAMQDTLGQVSARTGGLASSYAASAADQSYNDYMTKLQDAAQSMYQNDLSDQYKKLDMLEALDSNDYAKYQDLLSQYNTGRSYSQSAYQYNKSSETDAANTAYSQNEAKAQTLAAAGDFSGYKDLYGLTDAQVAGMEAAYKKDDQEALAKLYAQYGIYDKYVQLLGGSSEDASKLNGLYAAANAVTSSGGSSGSSGSSRSSGSRSSGSSSGSSSGGSDTSTMASDIAAYVATGGNADTYLKLHYKEYGFTSLSTAKAAYADYTLTQTNDTYNAAASNYRSVLAACQNMQSAGSSKSEILAAIKDAWKSGVLNQVDYMTLTNKFRG